METFSIQFEEVSVSRGSHASKKICNSRLTEENNITFYKIK